MRFVLVCVALAACGGKIDTGDDGGTTGVDGGGGSDAAKAKDVQPGMDVISPPTQCSPITGGTSVSSDGSCTTTATWTCGATTYDVKCSCPDATCTCSQESGGMGAGTSVKAAGVCPGCNGASLPDLCGFPH